jgi:hypothetical protein
MDTSGSSASFLALTIIGASVLLGGCAQNAPYHTIAGALGNCRGQKVDEGCTQAYYQEHDNYDLAFVEFSDRGNAFNDQSVRNVLDRIREKASQEGVVVVTFVHGWKHNASETDDNVKSFNETLQALGDELKKELGKDPALGRRRLIGVYVGWRGASLDAPLLDQTTFWDRKAAAEEVGKGGVTSLLLELNQILEINENRDNSNKDVLVIVGHSFGGAIVVSALNEVLTDRVVKRTKKRSYARPFGDGVIIINPAIEATQALPFVEAAIQDGYQQDQRPLFVSLSSDADWATHYMFPMGETVGLLLTWRQADLKRGYLHDRRHPTEALPLREENLDTTTVGNFAPFLTHRLTKRGQDGEVDFSFQTCSADPKGCEPKGLTTLSGQPMIDLPPNYPLYFIKTDATVMTEHNDIFNPAVRAFVFTVIDDVVRGKLASIKARSEPGSSPMPSILTRPDDLVRQTRERYAEMSKDTQD